MGTWGSESWENDFASDWFSHCFDGCQIASRVEVALTDDSELEIVRAACFVLEVLGRSEVWPGDLEDLDRLICLGIEFLESRVQELGEELSQEVLESIDRQLQKLRSLRKDW